MKQFESAIADYDAALKLDPKIAAALYGRELARRARGDNAAGEADIAAAKRIQPDIRNQFQHYGVRGP